MTKIAVVGATGLVGRAFLREIKRQGLVFDDAVLLASEKSAGKKTVFCGREYVVEKTQKNSFKGVDIALFCAGSSVSKEFVPFALDSGAKVVDNSSFFRMKQDVPLVCSKINLMQAKGKSLVANPNCSTLAVLPAVASLKKFGLKCVRYATYQSVSGAGKKGLEDFFGTKKGFPPRYFCADVSKNCIALIGEVLPDFYTEEERKMQMETQKILGLPSLGVSATCVRVPVAFCHSVCCWVETLLPIGIKDATTAFLAQNGVILAQNGLPLASGAKGKSETFVGRVRKDDACQNGITFFCVADNLFNGAASNAVEIARFLLE